MAKLPLRHRDLHEVRTEDHLAAEACLLGAVAQGLSHLLPHSGLAEHFSMPRAWDTVNQCITR